MEPRVFNEDATILHTDVCDDAGIGGHRRALQARHPRRRGRAGRDRQPPRPRHGHGEDQRDRADQLRRSRPRDRPGPPRGRHARAIASTSWSSATRSPSSASARPSVARSPMSARPSSGTASMRWRRCPATPDRTLALVVPKPARNWPRLSHGITAPPVGVERPPGAAPSPVRASCSTSSGGAGTP